MRSTEIEKLDTVIKKIVDLLAKTNDNKARFNLNAALEQLEILRANHAKQD